MRPNCLCLCRRVTAFALLALSAATSHADAYRARPKLVIVLVIDQFRGDYLERYRDDFKTASGFNLFLKQGAYFPDCYYQYANTMTAPGHSTIGTGAYTAGHGIALNDWWDLKRSPTHTVSSVQDERYDIVGDHAATDIGTSPRNELASTLGDEVVLATHGASKLFGISLKDRAAILTSGHASNGAFWLDHDSGHFVSSTYWGPKLPDWAEAFNRSGRVDQAIRHADVVPGHFYDDVGGREESVSYLLDFAQALIAGEQMGRHDTTDILTISISSTDILGHRVGPDSPEMRTMIDAVDVDLDRFFGWVGQHVDGGMENVWVSLTGDHGIGPTIEGAAESRMAAAVYNLPDALKRVNARLNERFSPGANTNYLLLGELPYVTLDPRPFEAAKVPEAQAENAVAELLPAAFAASMPPAPEGPLRLPTRAVVRRTYTKVQLKAGDVPATEEGHLVLNSYSPNGEWYVMLAPGMYAQAQGSGTNHYTPYSYDRHVPLAFYGSAFVPGTYHQPVEPTDIAVTFASLLRVNRPSAATGHVLTFALKPGW